MKGKSIIYNIHNLSGLTYIDIAYVVDQEAIHARVH